MGGIAAALQCAAFGIAQNLEMIVVALHGTQLSLGLLQMLQHFLHGDDPVSGGVGCGAVDFPGLFVGTDAEIVKEPLAEPLINGSCGLGVAGGQLLHQDLVQRLMVRLCRGGGAADISSFLMAAPCGQQLGGIHGSLQIQSVEMGADGHDPHFGGLLGEKFALIQGQCLQKLQQIPVFIGAGAAAKGFEAVAVQLGDHVAAPAVAAVPADHQLPAGTFPQLVQQRSKPV